MELGLFKAVDSLVWYDQVDPEGVQILGRVDVLLDRPIRDGFSFELPEWQRCKTWLHAEGPANGPFRTNRGLCSRAASEDS